MDGLMLAAARKAVPFNLSSVFYFLCACFDFRVL
jgi:hypothetical protein